MACVFEVFFLHAVPGDVERHRAGGRDPGARQERRYDPCLRLQAKVRLSCLGKPEINNSNSIMAIALDRPKFPSTSCSPQKATAGGHYGSLAPWTPLHSFKALRAEAHSIEAVGGWLMSSPA